MKPIRYFSGAAVYDRRVLVFVRSLAGFGRFDRLTAGDPALQPMGQCGCERERVDRRKPTRSRSRLQAEVAKACGDQGGHR
jgi:hypothetical protein